MVKKNNSSSGDKNTNVKSESSQQENNETIPDEFKKVMTDFINDFTTTFPEYSEKLKDNFVMVSIETNGNLVTEEMLDEIRVKSLYEYSKSIYPARFFDILYKNSQIFSKDNKDVNVCFLPDIDFKEVWNTPDISDNTRDTIWKYLQLILFSIITNISDRDSFGDTAKLFEAINEDELKSKLEETIKNMQNLFMGGEGNTKTGEAGDAGDSGDNSKMGDEMNMEDFEKFAEQFKNFSPENMGIDMSKFPGFEGFPGFNSANTNNDENNENASSSSSSDSKKQHEMPNPEAIHDHISKLLNGKIGALAKEIAEETAQDFDLGIDMENSENINMSNVFQKLFKNPGKLMNMVKNVGKKLDDKFKKGDIKESELMKEASDLLSNMKNMPGMGDLSSMLGKMGMSGLGGLAGLGGKGGKINMGALQSHLQQNMKNAKMKERMQSKLQQKQSQPQPQPQAQQINNSSSNGIRPTTSVYMSSSGENIQQTPRTSRPANVSQLNQNDNQNTVLNSTQSLSSTNVEQNKTSLTGYEQVIDQQKKKKKNKNKK